MKRLLTTLAALAMALAIAIPAGAVTGGGYEDTDNDYDMVGLMVAFTDAGTPLWRCSGALISPTLFLTAGHCTESPAASAQIWFDQDVRDPGTGYGTAAGWVGDASGSTYTHPQYNPNAFFLYDLGMVVLDAPYTDVSAYASVVGEGDLNSLKPGKRSMFTAVGYGVQRIHPSFFLDPGFDRNVAHPHLLQINTPGFTSDFSLMLSNNHSTGGTCFGDSGGPNFLGDTPLEDGLVIAGVTSFGLNSQCGGTGGVYRIDGADDVAWISTFLP